MLETTEPVGRGSVAAADEVAGAPARLRSWSHKPAIDGLRAIAVVAVLLYHGGVRWAPGGFLGVDLFFALSGYLITALLLIEHRERGHVDAKAFWIRRAKRLLPALFLMMLAVAVYVALFAGAEEAIRLRGDGLATIFYGANWWYVYSGASYFESFEPSMFRHTWSLGIEEQFYLVWPLIFMAGYRWSRGRTQRLAVLAVGAAIASATLMFMLYSPQAGPSRAFYGSDTRAQALLLGAALAMILHAPIKQVIPDGWLAPIGAVALLGCVAMFTLASDQQAWLYQGGFLLIAILAVGLIASAAGDPATPMNRVLGLSPFVWIGSVSYGLYLWHWPIFVFLDPERTGMSDPPLLVLRLAVTFAVATFSYYVIEKPVREIDFSSRVFVTGMAGSTILVALLLFASTQLIGGVADPLTAHNTTDPNAKRILVNGDSVGFSLAMTYAGAGGFNVSSAAMLGCGVARAPNQPIDRPALEVGGHSKCDTWPDKWRDSEKNFKPDLTVVEIGAWEVFDKIVDGKVLKVGTPEWRAYILSELEFGFSIAGARGKPVVFLNVPCFRSTPSLRGPPNPERIDPLRIDAVNAVLDEFAAAHKQQVHVLDLKSFLCPGGRYADRIGGVKVRQHGVHFTQEGGALVWQWLAPQLTPLL
jgi:peptidoglycan/LPS O-acetylase OafA/YrhL